MKRLEGKVAVVTEAVGSVGLATARKFVDEGARVFITGRDKAQLAAALETLGNKATAVQGVVTDPGDLDRLLSWRTLGRSTSSLRTPGSSSSPSSVRSPRSISTGSSISTCREHISQSLRLGR